MSKRLTTGVLAAFYLLQATWLLHAGMDLLLPKAREAAAAVADSCCNKTCGCPEEVKVVSGCCCGGAKTTPAAQAPASRKAPVSVLEAARCKGAEEAMTQAFTQPVVCGFAVLGVAVLESSPVAVPELRTVPLFTSTSLDKVPIARA